MFLNLALQSEKDLRYKNKDIPSYLTMYTFSADDPVMCINRKNANMFISISFYVCISIDYHETTKYESLKCFKFLHELDLFGDQAFDLVPQTVFNNHIEM